MRPILLPLLFLLGCAAQADEPACEPTRVVLYVRAHLDGIVCDAPTDGSCCPEGFDAVGLDGSGNTVCVGY